MHHPSALGTRVLCLGIAFGAALPASAQEKVIPVQKLEEVKKQDGWDYVLIPGASLSISDTRNVIGQAEGLTMTAGVNFKGSTSYRKRAHEGQGRLELTELFTQTPLLDEFVKSMDMLKLEAIYLYHWAEWLGPFAKLNLDTAVLTGYDVRKDPVDYAILRRDGSIESRTGRRLFLTDPFQPLALKESAGIFAQPYKRPELNVETSLGAGALHLFADGGRAVKDDAATPEIEVLEVASFSQGGVMWNARVYGELYEKRLVYQTYVEVMVPFLNSEDIAPKDAWDLTNVELSASLSFKIFTWLSLDYVLRAVRQPQLIDEFQVQNNLLLTASYTFPAPKA